MSMIIYMFGVIGKPSGLFDSQGVEIYGDSRVSLPESDPEWADGNTNCWVGSFANDQVMVRFGRGGKRWYNPHEVTVVPGRGPR
jgi:hypothetical protein